VPAGIQAGERDWHKNVPGMLRHLGSLIRAGMGPDMKVVQVFYGEQSAADGGPEIRSVYGREIFQSAP